MVKALDVIWGAKRIGEAINKSPRQAQYLLETGAINAARKVSNKKRSQWCASITGLQEQFGGELNEAADDEA